MRSNLPHQPGLRNLPCKSICFPPGTPCWCWFSSLSCVFHQCPSTDGRHKAGLSLCVLHAALVPCWPTYRGREKKPSLHPLICCTPWRVNERCLMRTAHSASCWETQPPMGPLPEPFPVPVPEMLPQTQTGGGQGNKPCPGSVFWLPWQYAHPCWSRLGSTEVQKTTRRNVRTWHTVTVTRWGA